MVCLLALQIVAEISSTSIKGDAVIEHGASKLKIRQVFPPEIIVPHLQRNAAKKRKLLKVNRISQIRKLPEPPKLVFRNVHNSSHSACIA